jgi:N-methylhydantoinase B
MVEEYSFHNEGGGYGEFQGGNGQYLTFKVLSDEAFLTELLGYLFQHGIKRGTRR